MKCTVCKKVSLTGRQTKFCSTKCSGRMTNSIYQSYLRQRERGIKRKLMFIEKLGGQCQVCGYKKNSTALNFHHRDPSKKKLKLDIRVLSNNSMDVILSEIDKCDLLCANCHAEHHNPLHAM